MAALEFRDDGKGNLELSDKVFERRQFDNLTIDPPVGKTALIRNTRFVDCTVSPGTCVVGSGVTLDRVVFANLDCGDALGISSEASLKEVVVIGQKPPSLIVKPESEKGFVMPHPDRAEFQLDVSQFHGNVSIIGVRGRMVRKNPDRHVAVRANWKTGVNWKELGIGPFSYWRIFVFKLNSFKVEEGVFSLPEPSDKDFGETMREKKCLENAGLTFE